MVNGAEFAKRNKEGGRRGRSPRRREVHPRAPSPPATAVHSRKRKSPRAAAAAPRRRIESTPETPNRCAQQPGDRAATPYVAAARPSSPRSESATAVAAAARVARAHIGSEHGQRGGIRQTQQGRWPPRPLAPAARGPSSSSIAAGDGRPFAKKKI